MPSQGCSCWRGTAAKARAELAAVCREWLDAHQQAAEEDLMMPVVLEEFGSKLDARCGAVSLA